MIQACRGAMNAQYVDVPGGLFAQDEPVEHDTHAMIENLKRAGEDFEWYPTTVEMLSVVARRIRKEDDYRRSVKILDIGAGDGRSLARLKEMLESDNRIDVDRFAIEKSMIHLANMPKQIVCIGTDFHEQTLIDKEFDVVFCNPPYSEYEDWTYRILKECAACSVYLVIPRRWRDSKRLADLVSRLELVPESLGEFDFEDAERRARAKVEIVRFDTTERDKNASFDAAIEEMMPELDKFECELDSEPEPSKSWDTQVAEGGGLIESLVLSYEAELSELYETYRAVAKINPRILKELGVMKPAILKGIREKTKGLKNKYWSVLFEHLSDVTKRFASKQRAAFLDSLQSKTVVDFTHGNVQSMLIWISKWSSDYFDEQLIELFQRLATKCNVHQYKSNHKVWVEDRWRYSTSGEKDPNSHYKVDYRLVVSMYGAINTSGYSWDARNGLNNRCHEFLGDIATIANNLGFSCMSRSEYMTWSSGKTNEFLMDNGDILMDVKAFKNGNLHIRINKRLMLAINVQVGKLLGWIHSAEEAVQELQPDHEDIAYVQEAFRLTNRIESSKLLRLQSPRQNGCTDVNGC